MEEAMKMRNLLQEFLKKHDGIRHPSILGLREHIFTGRQNLSFSLLIHYFFLILPLMASFVLSSLFFLLLNAVCHRLLGSCLIKKQVLLPLVRDFWPIL